MVLGITPNTKFVYSLGGYNFVAAIFGWVKMMAKTIKR